MEALALKALLGAPAVDAVAEQRVPDVGHVDADLVRAPGLEPAAQVRPALVAGDDLPVRDGAAASGHDGHALAVRRASGYRRVDRAGVLPHAAAHDALVDARQAVVGELGAEGEVRGVVLRGDNEARGVLVYAVDDAGPPLAAYAGEAFAAVEDKRVYKRAVRVPRRGMDDHAPRLVDHDGVRVLKDHVERYVLRRKRDLGRLRQLDAVYLAGGGFPVLLHLAARERDRPALNEPLGLRAGQLLDITRKESVDALAALQGFYV